MRKKIIKITLITTKLSTYWLAFCLLATGVWIHRNFDEPSFEQILYHVQFGFSGLIDADRSLIRGYIKNCLIYPVIPAIVIFLYEKFVLLVKKVGIKQAWLFIKASFYKTIKKSAKIIYKFSVILFRIKLPLILLILATLFFLTKAAFWTYLKNTGETDFIVDNYFTPKSIIAPHKKKNLVLIYVESLESTYANSKLFDEDLLAPLDNLKVSANSLSFTNYEQTFGTGWTIAGIVATQCGIPLRPIVFGGNEFGESAKAFLPNIVCLGDILKQNGYKNVFMGGAHLSFSGKGKFLEQHGYDQVYGADEWEKMGETGVDFNEWGLYDDLLLKVAKKTLDSLEQGKQPFNLTILTSDTHQKSGYINDTCRKKGVVNFTGIVKCTSELLADFVYYMSEKGYLKNTTVVILGDHLAMRNDAYDKLTIEKNRTIFNKFITTEKLEKNRDRLYHFSMFPSILNSLGFKFEENRSALGASGLGKLDPKFLVESYDPDVVAQKLSSFSKKYLDFWKIKK